MKTLFFKILFIITMLLGLITCKKYPEDGKRSWQTVKKRLTNHRWVLKEYLVNSGDSINLYHRKTYYNQPDTGALYYNLRNAELEFTNRTTGKDNGGPFVGGFVTKTYISTIASAPNLSGPSASLVWSGKTGLSISAYSSSNTKLPLLDKINESNGWEIKKLTDKELIIKTTDFNNRVIQLKFQR